MSATDLSELMELWAELNLTDHHNLSQVEAVLCSGAVGHGAFLRFLSVLYMLIFVVGVAANAAVVWVNLRCEGRGYETHLYVLNLAAADLCAMATLPLWVMSLLQGGRWPFGGAACKVAHLVFSVNLFSSIFFLACMSVDRYLSATLLANAAHGGRKKEVRRLTCVLVWLLALAASVPESYFLQTVKSSHSDGAVCRPVYPSENARGWMAGVQLSFTVLGFAIPLPVIAVSYLLLAAALPPGSDQERRLGRRIVLTYIVVFAACWLPFHAVLLLDTLSVLNLLPFSCRLERFLDVALHLTQAVSLAHCCANPVLYGLLLRGDRRRLVKAAIFKYSAKTGLARLLGGSHASDAERSAVATDSSVLV